MRIKKGQSILEYVIVLTAIVGVVIAGALLFTGKDEKNPQGVGKIMSKSAETMKAATGKIANMQP